MECDSHALLLARTFANLCFGHEPKARVVTMDVLQNDELFDKMNIKGNWNFKITLYCYNCDFFYSHTIIQNKRIFEFGIKH